MLSQLKKHGNSLTLELNDELLKKLDITDGKNVDIHMIDDSIIIHTRIASTNTRKEKIDSAYKEISTQYAGTLKRLAE